MSELEYCRRCLFCCQTHRSPRVKFIGRARDSLNKLTDRTSWQPRHSLRRTVLKHSELFRCELVIYVHYMHCMLWCHNCHTASSSLRRTTLISLYLACLWGYIKFATWITAVASLTLNCFCIFFYWLFHNCFSDSCAIVVTVCLYNMFFLLFFFFSGLLRRTVACK